MNLHLSCCRSFAFAVPCFFALPTEAEAALLFYEGFSAEDYEEGSVFGQALVGAGYAAGGTWNSTSQFVAEGLTHPVLETTPGFHFSRTAGENPTLFDLSPEGPFGAAGLIGTNGMIGGTGVSSPIYYSVLARKDDEGTLDGFAGFQVFDSTQGAAGEGIGPGEVGQPNYKWFQQGANNTIGVGTPLEQGKTVLFVVKMDYDEVEPMEATLWIDPDITLSEEAQSPDSFTVVPNAKVAGGFDSFRMRGSRNWSFDEIRFGTTWDSVTPRLESTPLAITAFSYEPTTTSMDISWGSRSSETYVIKVSTDLLDWETTVESGIAADAGELTSRTLNLSSLLDPALAGAKTLFFRIEVE